LLIIVGAVAAGLHWVAITAALFSVVTFAYLLKVINRMFLRPDGAEPTAARESPRMILLALVILVVLTLAFGIGFKQVLEWIVGPAASVLFHGLAYAQLVLGG
jgi:NADH:ubiquinone oxidoreductase subunit 2 (subunit N)